MTIEISPSATPKQIFEAVRGAIKNFWYRMDFDDLIKGLEDRPGVVLRMGEVFEVFACIRGKE